MKEEINFASFTRLATERLLLRPLMPSDEMALFILRSDDIINQYIDRPKQTSLEQSKPFITKINDGINENKSMYWAITIKDNPELVGTICLWNFSGDKKTAELGYELNRDFQGRGIMNEAIKKVIELAFQTLGLTTIEACTHKNNAKSISLLLKNNFSLDATRKDEENINLDIFILRKKVE